MVTFDQQQMMKQFDAVKGNGIMDEWKDKMRKQEMWQKKKNEQAIPVDNE